MKYLDLPTITRCVGRGGEPGGAGCRHVLWTWQPPLPPACPAARCRRINSFLDSVDVGELIVQGTLEAYSCALAGACIQSQRRCVWLVGGACRVPHYAGPGA